jgi:branched-chain amino acid transport system ATP-binding protein
VASRLDHNARRLEARSLSIAFEGLRALSSVDLQLDRGEILGLIGPNGAGKTTLVNVVSGFVRPQEGTVTLEGRDVTRANAEQRARLGLVRTFQNVRVFRELSVLENVELGCVGLGMGRREGRKRAEDLLQQHGLAALAARQASTLAYGDERRVGVLRALASSPKYLLLDEPTAGLDENESDELADTIRSIRDEYGCGVLVIDHDMRMVMGLCDRVQVLDYGKSLAVGSPAAIRRDPAVIQAYLGSQGEVI